MYLEYAAASDTTLYARKLEDAIVARSRKSLVS